MFKSKSQKENSLTVSLALALSLGGATIASFTSAPAGLAAPSNWYDNENTFLDRGKREYNSGQFDQAVRDLTECIKLNSNRADVYYWRSVCYSALHQNDQAIADLDQAVRLDPHSAIVFLNRGLIYSNQGKHQAAVSDFDEALKLDANLSEARQNRDFCLKEIEKAKGIQQKATEQSAQTAVAASGGSVLAVADGNTTGGAGTGGSAAGAASTSASSGQSSNGSSYTPYVGKGDPKLIAMQKEQREQRASEAKSFREKSEAERLATERFKAEAKSQELAIREKETEERLENARIKRQELEAKKLAMATSTVVPPTGATKAAKGGRPTTGGNANAEQSASAKTEGAGGAGGGAGDALDIVNRPVRDKWALIIGISEFQDSKLNLHYPAKDAKDFYSFLTNEGNFAKDHVKLLVNQQATRTSIMSELGDKWLPRVANPDDLVLIYISSHGSPSDMDVDNVNYLLAYDTDPDNLYATGLPMQDLTRLIKARVHSDRVVVVLDACHSGGAEAGGKGVSRTCNVDPDAIAQGTGQLVISSSASSQVSWESKNYENSVFTRCLIDSLRKNGNATTLKEAFDAMHDQVQEQVLRERGVLQTPVLRSQWKGSEVRISTPPTAPRAGL